MNCLMVGGGGLYHHVVMVARVQEVRADSGRENLRARRVYEEGWWTVERILVGVVNTIILEIALGIILKYDDDDDFNIFRAI